MGTKAAIILIFRYFIRSQLEQTKPNNPKEQHEPHDPNNVTKSTNKKLREPREKQTNPNLVYLLNLGISETLVVDRVLLLDSLCVNNALLQNAEFCFLSSPVLQTSYHNQYSNGYTYKTLYTCHLACSASSDHYQIWQVITEYVMVGGWVFLGNN